MSVLDNQSKLNPTTAFYAPASGGGGGGGGVGPNPSFSTINISPAGGIIMNTDANFDTPALQFNVSADGTLSENFLFRDAQSGNLSDGGKFLALQYFTPGLNTGGILGVRGLNFSSQFEGEAGAGVIGVSGSGTSIYLEGVSTINGAAPGGGGGGGAIPPNLALSSLTLNPDSGAALVLPGSASISINTTGATPGQLTLTNTGTSATNDISFTTNAPADSISGFYQPGGAANIISILSADGLGCALNLGASDVGGPVIAAADNSAGKPSTITVVSDNLRLMQPAASSGSMLSIQAVDTNLYEMRTDNGGSNYGFLQVGYSGGRNQVYAATGTVDNLYVSSVNGAAYPPSASGLTKTVVPTLASVNILGDGAGVAITGTFTTLANHLYNMIGFVYGIASPNISSNASLQWQLGNIDRAYNSATPLWGYSAAGGAVFGNTIPINLSWVATGTSNQAIYGYMSDPLGTAVSTFTNASADLLLIDLGPVTQLKP